MVDPSLLDEILLIHNALVKARFPENVFGELKASEKTDQERELKTTYRTILKKIHPDKYAQIEQASYLAQEATSLVNNLYEKAKAKINSNSYGEILNDKSSFGDATSIETTFDLNDYCYELLKDPVQGDFCDVFFGVRENDSGLEHICFKVVEDKSNNSLLEREKEILTSITHKSIPIFLDSAILEDDRQANILRRVEGSYDLYEVKDQFPDGVPQEHAVWILDRLLSVLGYLHTNKIIHGSIEPGNILITPHNHNGFLIDYTLGIKEATKTNSKYFGTNDYSAPEIEKGESPHPSSDLYSLGKSIIFLMGGNNTTPLANIDPKLNSYLANFVTEDPSRRTNDAWKAWHELKQLRKEVFGAENQFLELCLD